MKPVVQPTNIWAGKVVSGSITVEVAVACVHAVTVTINGVAATLTQGTGFSSFPGFEVYARTLAAASTITIVATDAVTSEARTVTVSLIVDATSPTIVSVGPATFTAAWLNNTLGSVAGANRVIIRMDPGTYTWPYTGVNFIQRAGGYEFEPVDENRRPVIIEAAPRMNMCTIRKCRITGSTPGVPIAYARAGCTMRLEECEIYSSLSNYDRMIAVSGDSNSRRMAYGCYVHHVSYGVVGASMVQRCTFDEIGADNCQSCGGLIEGNIGLKLRVPSTSTQHADVMQWYGGSNYQWDNVFVRHNVFIDQESQGLYWGLQNLSSSAIVSNLISWGGNDHYWGFHWSGGVFNDVLVAFNTFIGGYAGIRVADRSPTDPISVTNCYFLNNFFNSDGSDSGLFNDTGTGNIYDYNAALDTTAIANGLNNLVVPNPGFLGPFNIITSASPLAGAGTPVPTLYSFFGIVQYDPTTPQIGWSVPLALASPASGDEIVTGDDLVLFPGHSYTSPAEPTE